MTSYKLLVGDMFDMIDEVDPFSVKCACIDPPYMIGTQSVDRANKIDPWADLMNAARFYRDVLEVIRPKLTVDGSLWVFMNWRGLALPRVMRREMAARLVHGVEQGLAWDGSAPARLPRAMPALHDGQVRGCRQGDEGRPNLQARTDRPPRASSQEARATAQADP